MNAGWTVFETDRENKRMLLDETNGRIRLK